MEHNRKNLSISADDFGISPKADQNILELIRQNKLDRVEIMMSKNIKTKDVKILLESGIKLDIHLHLIEKKIDRWQEGKEARVIDSGIIKRVLLFFLNIFLGEGAPKKAAAQWEKQIREFILLFGKNPDGVSSHEHIHYFTPYFKRVLVLAEKYHIPYIRLGKESLEKEPCFVAFILNWFKNKNLTLFENSGLASSDYLISYDWIENNFENFIKKIPEEKNTELVFHPELDGDFSQLESTS